MDLPGGYVAGPVAISEDRMILMLETGETVCFDSSLKQVWTATLPPDGNDRMAGQPTVIDGQLMLAFVSGVVVAIDPDNGDVIGTVDLGQPIAHAPVELNGQIYVTGADGTLHMISNLTF